MVMAACWAVVVLGDVRAIGALAVVKEEEGWHLEAKAGIVSVTFSCWSRSASCRSVRGMVSS